MKQSDNQKGFGVVEVIVLIAILGLIGAGGWYVWQAQNRTSAPQSPDTSKSEPTQPAKTTATFDNKLAPFTFEYPKDWTVKVDPALKNGQPLPDTYSIALLAPGTTFGDMPIGGSEVTVGAQVIVRVSKTALSDVQGVFSGLRAHAQEKQSATVARLPAVQYEFGYESQPARYVDFIKDGRLHSLSYASAGNERSSASFTAFTALVASFGFK